MSHKHKTPTPTQLLIRELTEVTSVSYCSGCGVCPMPLGSVYIKGNLKGSGSGGFLVLCPNCRSSLKEKL